MLKVDKLNHLECDNVRLQILTNWVQHFGTVKNLEMIKRLESLEVVSAFQTFVNNLNQPNLQITNLYLKTLTNDLLFINYLYKIKSWINNNFDSGWV